MCGGIQTRRTAESAGLYRTAAAATVAYGGDCSLTWLHADGVCDWTVTTEAAQSACLSCRYCCSLTCIMDCGKHD
jgi:hypothetical protein